MLLFVVPAPRPRHPASGPWSTLQPYRGTVMTARGPERETPCLDPWPRALLRWLGLA